MPWVRSVCVAAIIVFSVGMVVAGESSSPPVELGRDLFTHEWSPNDPRSHGGDGLGPVYNAASCGACHSQGGEGGAAGSEKNVLLLSAVVDPRAARAQTARHRRANAPPSDVSDLGLIRYHAGFRDGSTVVLHRHGEGSRRELRQILALSDSGLTPMPCIRSARLDLVNVAKLLGSFASEGTPFTLFGGKPERSQAFQDIKWHTLHVSELNPPPLFGLGRIDQLSERDIESNARTEPPRIRGRLREIRRGVVGKFGWKEQTATLDEFVHIACAGELGLEVPGHHQAMAPDGPIPSKGLDLNENECQAITAYLASLPSPTRAPGSDADSNVQAGEDLFREVGCAGCHAPRIGSVSGIYSDLLLHDLGPLLGSAGTYSGAPVSSDSHAALPPEWRTPPLWGYRDSAPYLHDGRAWNLDEAVHFHAGQAKASRDAYEGLSKADQGRIELFLKSMVAPMTVAPAPSTVSRLAAKLHAAKWLATRGRDDGAKALYHEVADAAPGAPQSTEARFQIDAMSLEGAEETR